jgi:hypothetical protein
MAVATTDNITNDISYIEVTVGRRRNIIHDHIFQQYHFNGTLNLI